MLGAGFLTGRRAFGLHPLSASLLAPLICSVPLAIVGSALYITYALSPVVISILLWIPVLSAFLACRFPSPHPEKSDGKPFRKNVSRVSRITLCLYGILIGGFFASLGAQQTTESLLGPWDNLYPLPFVLYGLASILAIILSIQGMRTATTLSVLVIHFFASISVAFIRFPLAFGFDPILHMAAERVIMTSGAIEPKTFYYTGMYVIVPFFSRLFALPLEWVHQSLLPLVVALSIPPLAWSSIRSFFRFTDERSFLLALFILLIPYPYVIMTTPWGLAYSSILLALMSSAIACAKNNPRYIIFASVCALFSLSLHPLAGIPLVLFIVLVSARNICSRAWRMLFLVAGTALSAIGIPLAFYINSVISPQFRLTLQLPNIGSLFSGHPLISIFQTRFSSFLDFAYFFSTNGWLIFMGLAICGAVMLLRRSSTFHPEHGMRHFLIVCLLMAAALRIDAWLTAEVIHFDALAVFEQQDYAQRLVHIADLFLLPFAGFALGMLLSRVFTGKNAMLKIVVPLFFAGALTSALYLSYPRNDAYTPFHGRTLSATDISVVRFVDADGGAIPHVVMANQVLASAAIREFGFKTYFTVSRAGKQEAVFYYPIPSGSPLAPLYYAMLTSPSRTLMNRAMDTVGVTRSYFVVRDYEARFPIIIRDAKKTADSWREIDMGKAYVFMYEKDY